jgi:hypothetical protein
LSYGKIHPASCSHGNELNRKVRKEEKSLSLRHTYIERNSYILTYSYKERELVLHCGVILYQPLSEFIGASHLPETVWKGQAIYNTNHKDRFPGHGPPVCAADEITRQYANALLGA